MNTRAPTPQARFEGKHGPSSYSLVLETVANKFLKKIECRQLAKFKSGDRSTTVLTAPSTKAAVVVKSVPSDLLEGVIRCKASIIEEIKDGVFQEFVHNFGLKGESTEIDHYVHKGRPGYKIFLAFCNSRFKADQLLGVGAFDDLERLSTDYKAFMTTFHEIWKCRIEPVKVANLTDLMEATAHEGPITLNDSDMGVIKALHDMYWGEHGPVDIS